MIKTGDTLDKGRSPNTYPHAVVGTRSFKILLGDDVPTDKTAFTENLMSEGNATHRSIMQ